MKAFDQWGNPALDGQVGVETSLGQLLRLNEKTGAAPAVLPSNAMAEPVAQVNQVHGQMVMQLEGGEAVFKLVGPGAPGEAKLRAQTGQLEAAGQVRITSEMRSSILVGFAEMSFGRGIPEVGLRGEHGNFRRRVSFFYSGQVFGNNMLTLSYRSIAPPAAIDFSSSIRSTGCTRYSVIPRRASKPPRPTRRFTRVSIISVRTRCLATLIRTWKRR